MQLRDGSKRKTKLSSGNYIENYKKNEKKGKYMKIHENPWKSNGTTYKVQI